MQKLQGVDNSVPLLMGILQENGDPPAACVCPLYTWQGIGDSFSASAADVMNVRSTRTSSLSHSDSPRTRLPADPAA
jgi:hypothetical protein